MILTAIKRKMSFAFFWRRCKEAHPEAKDERAADASRENRIGDSVTVQQKKGGSGMRLRIRAAAALLCAAMMLGGPAAAGAETEAAQAPAGSALERIRQRGALLVGATGDYKPMSYLDPETGTYWGFDAALAQDLAAALGVELQYVPTSWPTLTADTLAEKFDLALCGITVTGARKEAALMSDGYLDNGKTILCRAEDADRYACLEDINRPEVRVMVNPGGLNEQFARENLPRATLIVHDVNHAIPGLVAAGEADIMITEIMEAGYYIARDSRLAAPLIGRPFTHGQLGVLMPKGSEDLLAFVNRFLAEEKASGRIDGLAREYIYRQDADDGEDGPTALPPAA